MATFQAQIEGLTGLSLTASTAPTLNEVTQFLRDGVLDVTQKCIRMNPQDASGFTRVSSDQTSNNSLDINGATILSVVREAGVSDDWRECRQIPPGLQSRVTDSTSLHYASPYNPAYVILDNGKVSVFPAPDSDPKQFKVYYINNVPVDKSSAPLLYSHSDIGFFLDDKVYLVVIYASMMSLNAVINDMSKATDVNTEIINDDPEMAQLELAKSKERLTEYVSTYKQLLHQYNGAFGLIQQRRSPRKKTDDDEVTT